MRILIVLPLNLSAAVFSNFVWRALKGHFPQATFYFTGPPGLHEWREIIVPCPYLELSQSSFRHRWMRGFKKSFDLVVDLRAPYEAESKWQFRAEKQARFKAHDSSLQSVPWLSSLSRWRNYLTLLETVGVTPHKLNFRIPLLKSTLDRVEGQLKEATFHQKDFTLLVLSLKGADSFIHHRWPYLPAFLRLFTAQDKILLIDPSHQFQTLSSDIPARVHVWNQGLTLAEVAALISLAKNFVGMNPDVINLASCVGTPGVGIFGPASTSAQEPPPHPKLMIKAAQVPCAPCFNNDGSYNWTCIDNICMKTIGPREIWKALGQLSND